LIGQVKEAYTQMKLIDFKTKLGTLFALALLFGIGLVMNSTANAQYPQYPNDRYRRDRDYRNQISDDVTRLAQSARTDQR
jgi:hypothetical protein